ncbi:MAG TPA: glycosyltransferase family 4 protein [Acetobacteraceae bacterium]|nr:glycosyltransferase family 4 protein [Acetobacteraceae bacterium]
MAAGDAPALIVEGWRFLPHSYAIVNQWQLLALLRRHIRLKVIDAPYYRPWQPVAGLFPAAAEQALRALEIARPGESARATLRLIAPFSFAPSASPLTAVFATSEQQIIRRRQVADAGQYARLLEGRPPEGLRVVTPSRWSAEAFHRLGFAPAQVAVVPHGVETEIFHPDPQARAPMRARLGIGAGDFVFLSVGAMTGNKGMDLLLRAFAKVCGACAGAKLVLKGVDPLYGSRALLEKSLAFLSARERQLVAERTVYAGETLSFVEMAALYQAADIYVSPYRAEGFNLPVLEAAACGVPVICTRGGPTDEFVTDEFARRIDSRKSLVAVEGQSASRLDPDLDHLTLLMQAAIEDTEWRRQAAQAGASHTAARYTWDHAADKLIRFLWLIDR